MQPTQSTPAGGLANPYEARRTFLKLLREIYRELGLEGELSDGSLLPGAVWNIQPGYEPVLLRLKLRELSGTIFFRLTCGYGPVGAEFGKWRYYMEGAISPRWDPRNQSWARNFSMHSDLPSLKEALLDRLRRYVEAHRPSDDPELNELSLRR